jgi:mRNA interferase MazF
VPFPPDAPRRGEVYWVTLDPVIGSEQAGRRPAVVISPDPINARLPTVVVAAITSNVVRRNSPVAPILPPGQPLPLESAVLTFQIRTIDRQRLQQFAGLLTPPQVQAVNYGLALSFGLR